MTTEPETDDTDDTTDDEHDLGDPVAITPYLDDIVIVWEEQKQ